MDISGPVHEFNYDGEDAWWINPFQTGPDPQSVRRCGGRKYGQKWKV
jgi:hypothetical protein